MDHNDIKLASLLHEMKTMLNETDIKLDDNFIELGGNSIMAMVIAERLLKNSGIKIDLAQLLGSQIGQIELTLMDK